MDHAAVAPPPPTAHPALMRGLKMIVVAGVAWFGLSFFFKDAVPYVVDFSSDQFGRFWEFRWWLIFHLAGGSVALIAGPFQFSSGLRRKNMKLHRGLGKAYLVAIAVGSAAALYMGFTSALAAAGAGYAFALIMLAVAWITTSGMALVMIKRRMIDLHKEWMIRSYVVTFAFVTFRWLFEMPTMETLLGDDMLITLMWASWTIPLGVTEVVLQLRRSGKAVKRRAAKATA
jgi:uncharacterized membrane protein